MVDGFAARLAVYFTFTTTGLRHFLMTGASAFAAEAAIASGFVPLEHRAQQPSLDAHSAPRFIAGRYSSGFINHASMLRRDNVRCISSAPKSYEVHERVRHLLPWLTGS